VRDDLLDAQACVDWTVANLDGFEQRLVAWLKANIYVAIKELPPHEADNLVVAIQRQPLTLAFNVEAGAFLNALRSALDMLAWAVAKRETFHSPKDIYFPVADSAAKFAKGDYHGSKFIRGISADHRLIFESHKPYKGGNDLLYALHQLDIRRKHRRLLSTFSRPARFFFTSEGGHFTFPTTFVRIDDLTTVLGRFTKGAPNPKFDCTSQIIFNEPDIISTEPVVAALRQFASLTHAIIESFDS